MAYAIISVGGKQYRVREGERLLVDRLATEPGKTFHPPILMVGGDGKADLEPKGVTVTARVVDHVLGEKVRIGKYRPKSGYRRHTGHRSKLSQIEIEKIAKRAAPKPKAAPEEKGEAEEKKTAAKPKASTQKKTESKDGA